MRKTTRATRHSAVARHDPSGAAVPLVGRELAPLAGVQNQIFAAHKGAGGVVSRPRVAVGHGPTFLAGGCHP